MHLEGGFAAGTFKVPYAEKVPVRCLGESNLEVPHRQITMAGPSVHSTLGKNALKPASVELHRLLQGTPRVKAP